MKRRSKSPRKSSNDAPFLVGTAALFLLAGLTLMSGRNSSDYDSVKELAADHERAFAGRPEALEDFKSLMAEYFACEAFAGGGTEVCLNVDSWAARPPSPFSDYAHSPPCRKIYLEGTALKALLAGAEQYPEACLAYARLDRDPEADEPGAEFEDCRDFAEFVHKADPGGFCRLDPPGPERRACLVEFAYLAGKPGRCRRIKDPRLRGQCEAKANLIRAIKEGRPERVASTIYAPLLDGGGAACGALGNKILARFKNESQPDSP